MKKRVRILPASLILVAAGESRRMGSSVRKPFLLLDGKPLFVVALERFRRLAFIKERVLVLHKNDISRVAQKWGKTLARLKVTKLVVGGKRRQDSVYEGLIASSAVYPLVLIHDAARPFVPPKVIEQVALEASRSGAAIAAIPAEDTLKEVARRGKIRATLPRAALWQAQTPQAFHKRLLFRGFEHAGKQKLKVTDDAQLVEALGISVRVVPSTRQNFKITTPADYAISRKIFHNFSIFS